uniref:Uncharacterized protein n=1 Tax=CrAss-like virus sp. ctYsL76 TaxID=2826826 RepID=A0A8S5QM22_9CAUD|nr:MAG TPA: hypothetical protein [CrAss-like virus sp. ctYsL76]
MNLVVNFQIVFYLHKRTNDDHKDLETMNLL